MSFVIKPRPRPSTIVCLASFFKGVEFLRECKRQGWSVVLITKEKRQYEAWPRESLDNLLTVPNDADADAFIRLVSEIARRVKVDRVVALEEYDVITASLVREHLCIDGMSSATTRRFRDKLAMRVAAQKAGINVPEFVHTLNHEDLHAYMQHTSPPWILKPRADVSAIGIEKLDDAETTWRALERLDARENLRERSPHYLLERFVPGDVFHVDSLVNNGRVIFAEANCYGRPPMKVAHEGGVFRSFTLRRDSDERRELLRLNRQLIRALGLRRGATHAEFIKGSADGRFYFLEIAARIGGAYIAEVAEAASGINLWREWAKLELSDDEHPYRLPKPRKYYGGIVLSLARQEHPDTSLYTDAEIALRVSKRYHVGLVVRSPKHARVQELLDDYERRFMKDFHAVAPPLERAE